MQIMRDQLCTYQAKLLKTKISCKYTADHKTLMDLYNRILEISKINLPEVRNSSITKSIELLGGYLCSIIYFTPLQLYSLFKTINLAERTKILI